MDKQCSGKQMEASIIQESVCYCCHVAMSMLIAIVCAIQGSIQDDVRTKRVTLNLNPTVSRSQAEGFRLSAFMIVLIWLS